MLRKLFAMLGLAAFLTSLVALDASRQFRRLSASAPGDGLVQMASPLSHSASLISFLSPIGRGERNQASSSWMALAAGGESRPVLAALDELSSLAVRHLVHAIALSGGRRSVVLFVLSSHVAQVHAVPRKRGRVDRASGDDLADDFEPFSQDEDAFDDADDGVTSDTESSSHDPGPESHAPSAESNRASGVGLPIVPRVSQ